MKRILLYSAIIAIVLILIAGGTIIVLNPTSTRGAEHLAYGQEIRIDDFAFAAVGSERVAQIGDQVARGIFYVVTFKVINRAKRVSFRFDPTMTRLVDNAGVEHLGAPTARAAWFGAQHQNDACAGELAAGTECSTVLVFDVPAETQAPVLKVKFGEGLLEIADALAYGNHVIQLK